jgi:hypothetical protein
MISASLIIGFVSSLWGSGALLGWLVRLGALPFLPVLGKAGELALNGLAAVGGWLGTAVADCFEKPSRLVIMTLCFYAGAWHFADWRPWYGFTKEKAAKHRVVKDVPAPKVAQKAAKRKTDTRSVFERNFNIF